MIRLATGHGLYSFAFTFDAREGVMIRVPFVGKAWSYGHGHSGLMGWTAVRDEHAQGLTD